SARALAIAARTWLVQNADRRHGCWLVADDSRAQRVSPKPATKNARRVARWTDRLILRGAPLAHHRSQGGPHTPARVQAGDPGPRRPPLRGHPGAAFPGRPPRHTPRRWTRGVRAHGRRRALVGGACRRVAHAARWRARL